MNIDSNGVNPIEPSEPINPNATNTVATTTSDTSNNAVGLPSNVELIDLTSEIDCDSDPSFASATDQPLDSMETKDKTSLGQPQQTSNNHAQQEPRPTITANSDLNEPQSSSSRILGSYNNPTIVRLASAVHNNEPHFRFGPYIPFTRQDNEILIQPDGIVKEYVDIDKCELAKRLNREMLPEDSIIEAPSLVTPFLLKKRTKWPSEKIQVAPQASNSASNSNGCDNIEPEKETNTSESQKKLEADFDQRNNDFIYCNQMVDGDYKQLEIIKLIYRKESDDLLMLPDESNSIADDANKRPVRDYIRQAAVFGLTKEHLIRSATVLAINDFTKTRVSDMLLNIGLNQVKEFTLAQDIKHLNWNVRNDANECLEHIDRLDDMKKILDRLKTFNKAYKTTTVYPCDQCDFKTNSMINYVAHKEVPHIRNRNLCCNWCNFKTRDAERLTFHTMVSHQKRCRFEKSHATIKCDFCPFETNHKKRGMQHIESCGKSFNQDTHLGPHNHDHEYPPAITMKPITRDDVICYERTIKEVRLSGRKPSAIRVGPSVSTQGQRKKCHNNNGNSNNNDEAIMIANNNATNHNSRPYQQNQHQLQQQQQQIQHLQRNYRNNSMNFQQNQRHFTYARRTYSSLQGNNNSNHDISVNNHVIKSVNENVSNHNNTGPIIINGNKNSNISFSNSPASIPTGKRMKYGNVNRSGSESPILDNDSTFVICEICDSYISDLQQLRLHMLIIHKVKLHSRVLESKPPLTCGRCGWRFFTDQGLERHLLGLHGLVTTNLQDQVNQETDSGRCTKCGRAFGNKLVIHMKDVHKLNLKSACLDYKCIVCGAVFNLYSLFENHVYSVHSEATKRTSQVN